MELLLLIALLTTLAWLGVLLKHHQRSQGNILPLVALAVLLTGSVFGYSFFHLSGGPIPITLDRMMLAGLLALCGLFWIRGSEDLRALNRVDWMVILLVVVNAISMATHDWHFLNNMPASRWLFFYLLPVSLYFVVRTVRMNLADLKWTAVALAGLGVYLAITAVAETRDLGSLVFPRYIMSPTEAEFLGRGRGPFLNPVSNGIFMVVCLCCVWMWWPRSSGSNRFWIMAITGILSIGIFCTLTRSVWMGFIASVGLFIWYPASRRMKGVMIMVATVVAVISFPVVGEKIFSFKRDKQVTQAEMEQSASLRPLFAIVALKMFQDRPIWGCGFGQYARAKYPYLQDPHAGKPLASTKYFMQHNVFLAYLTELGLIGVGVLLGLLGQMLISSWKLWKNKNLDILARQFGLLMVVMLVNYCVNGMFHDVSIIPMQNMLLFYLFGIVNNILTARAGFEPLKADSQRSLNRIEPAIPSLALDNSAG